MNGKLRFDDASTERIIHAFYVVYNAFGYRLLEAVYQRALMVELAHMGIPFRSQVPIGLLHRGVSVGDFKADLVIEESVIVECKAIEKLAPVHVSQVSTYLKASGLRTGLLLNFGPEPQVRRIDR